MIKSIYIFIFIFFQLNANLGDCNLFHKYIVLPLTFCMSEKLRIIGFFWHQDILITHQQPSAMSFIIMQYFLKEKNCSRHGLPICFFSLCLNVPFKAVLKKIEEYNQLIRYVLSNYVVCRRAAATPSQHEYANKLTLTLINPLVNLQHCTKVKQT